MGTLIKKNGNLLLGIPSLFDDFLNWSPAGDPYTGSVPAVNIRETEDRFQLEVAAPGMDKKDFKVELDNNLLVISSEKEQEEARKEQNYTRREFSYRSFRRVFNLPENMVDGNNISARYENGVLYVTAPKKEEAKAKPARMIKIA